MIEDGYLFEFTTPGYAFYYTNIDTDVVYSGKTFKAIPISSEGSTLKISSLTDNASWEISMTPNASIVELWDEQTPEDLIQIKVFRFNKVTASWINYWVGFVSHPVWEGNEFKLVCESEFSSLNARALRARMQISCVHDLYGLGCGASRGDFALVRTVISIDGDQLGVSGGAIPDNYLAQGYAEWIDPDRTVLRRRTVRSNDNGGDVFFTTLVNNLSIGQTITFYPGCDKTLPTCINVFNNSINYSSPAYMNTDQQPFGSDASVF